MRQRSEPDQSEQFFDEKAVAKMFGLSVKTIQQWRLAGGGPTYVKFSRSVRYRKADLDAFAESRTRAHTSEPRS